jgi:hypothetical protein
MKTITDLHFTRMEIRDLIRTTTQADHTMSARTMNLSELAEICLKSVFVRIGTATPPIDWDKDVPPLPILAGEAVRARIKLAPDRTRDTPQ